MLTWAPPGAELPAKPPAETFARSQPWPAPLTSHTGRRWRLVPRTQQVTPGRARPAGSQLREHPAAHSSLPGREALALPSPCSSGSSGFQPSEASLGH